MSEQGNGGASTGGETTVRGDKEQKFPLMLAPSKFGGMVLKLESFEQVWRLATIFAASGPMIPEIYRENPHGAAMAILWGQELDISPIQAIQGIAVIGGKPSVWGDLAVALVLRHKEFDGTSDGPMRTQSGEFLGWWVEIKRKDLPPVRREFTLKNAETAGLLGKTPSWRGSPERMCFNRARAFAQRDQFADALRGLSLADETQDYIDLPRDQWSDKPAGRASPAQPAEPMPQPKPRDPPLSGGGSHVASVADPAATLSAVDFSDLEQPEEFEPDTDQLLTSSRDKALLDFLSSSAPTAAQDEAPQAGVSVAEDQPKPKPLTRGQRAALDKALANAADRGLTEQSVVDEMGDNVHSGNFERALRWLEGPKS